MQIYCARREMSCYTKKEKYDSVIIVYQGETQLRTKIIASYRTVNSDDVTQFSARQYITIVLSDYEREQNRIVPIATHCVYCTRILDRKQAYGKSNVNLLCATVNFKRNLCIFIIAYLVSEFFYARGSDSVDQLDTL